MTIEEWIALQGLDPSKGRHSEIVDNRRAPTLVVHTYDPSSVVTCASCKGGICSCGGCRCTHAHARCSALPLEAG